jgi:hypothetical protein
MNQWIWAGLTAATMAFSVQAQSPHAATITLDGDWYLQAGTVRNLSAEGILVSALRYSMGPQQDGVGVWEDHLASGLREDRLVGSPTHYSTQVWDGLALGLDEVWRFEGLDLDHIVDAGAGVVDSQNLDFAGTSLRHAYVEVLFSDGFRAHAHLASTGWDVTQVLHIGQVSPVPEPTAAWLLVCGFGLLRTACQRIRSTG